jgi:hypothetical protein
MMLAETAELFLQNFCIPLIARLPGPCFTAPLPKI